MASLINPPLLDKTGKEIVEALTGEAVQPSASQYNAPISDKTGKQILEAIQKGGGGANVLTLYGRPNPQRRAFWAYKDPEFSQEYETLEEARSALESASNIKVYDDVGFAFPAHVVVNEEEAYVELVFKGPNNDNIGSINVYLYAPPTPDA